jgi:hypothetical protein
LAGNKQLFLEFLGLRRRNSRIWSFGRGLHGGGSHIYGPIDPYQPPIEIFHDHGDECFSSSAVVLAVAVGVGAALALRRGFGVFCRLRADSKIHARTEIKTMNTALLPLNRPSATQDAAEAVGVAPQRLLNAQRKILNPLKPEVSR